MRIGEGRIFRGVEFEEVVRGAGEQDAEFFDAFKGNRISAEVINIVSNGIRETIFEEEFHGFIYSSELEKLFNF